MASAYKKGQTVNVRSTKSGAVRTGKFVQTHPGVKGDFHEIKFDDGSTTKARAGQLTAA